VCEDRHPEGCPGCGGTGQIVLTGCPLDVLGEELLDFVTEAELFEKGLPPVAGGVIDQADVFIRATARWGAERARIRAEELDRGQA